MSKNINRNRKNIREEYAIKEIKKSPKDKLKIKEKVGLYPKILKYIDKDLLNDDEFCKEILLINGMSLKYMPEKIKRNKGFVFLAIEKSAGFALKYADDGLKADYEIVKKAVQKYKMPLKYASEDLQLFFKEKWDEYYKEHKENCWTGFEITYNGIRTSKEAMDELYEKEKNKKNKKKKKNNDIEEQEESLENFEEEQLFIDDYSFEEND